MIYIIGKNFINEGKSDKVIPLIKELAKETVKEEGCIRFEFYQDENNADILFMVEEWESKETLENHFVSEHFKRIVPQMREYMDNKPAEMTICKKII